MKSRAQGPMFVSGSAWILGSILFTLITATAGWAQRPEQQPPPVTTTPQDSYIMGLENRLEIVVHVMGEVERPGEYRVADNTDVLELISKAGGPTRFANMSNVSLRRITVPDSPGDQRIVQCDLSGFLKNKNVPAPPLLNPGDVVTVPGNKMSKWSTAFVLVRDIAIVASTYLLYLKIVED